MSQNGWAPWAEPFVDRVPVMAAMADWTRRCRDRKIPSRMYLHAITGMGVSSTATQFSKNYQDAIGALVWESGRRSDNTAVPFGEMMTGILRQLRAPEGYEKCTDAEKAAILAAICRDPHRKFVLVVDDYPNPAQLADLIPADAPGVTFIATSTARNDILDRQRFKDFKVTELPPDEAHRLFLSILDDTVDELDDTVISSLVELCDGIPLLVRILAAHIRGRAPRAQHMLTKLRKSRLHLLELDSSARFTTFLNTTYDELSTEQATAYRWLGSLLAANFSLDAATAVLKVTTEDTFTVLEDLVDLNLLGVDKTTHRYSMHPVLREDARRRALAIDTQATPHEIERRWTSWFLRKALPRGGAISQRWWVDPVAQLLNTGHPGSGPTRSESLQWFELESANLVSIARTANRNGFHDTAWQLCVVIWKYLHIHGLHDIWIDTHLAGLDSARTLHHDAAIMQLTNQLGAAYLELGQYDDARRHFTESLAAARRLHHILGEQSALEWLGKIAAADKDPLGALDLYRQSGEVVDTAGPGQLDKIQQERVPAILCLQQIRAYVDIGWWDRVVAEAPLAEGYFGRTDTDETDNLAKTALVVGRALLALGNTDAAILKFRAALASFETDGTRRHQADAHYRLGQAYTTAGQRDAAIREYHSALNYYGSIAHPRAKEIAQILDNLDG
ncbi:tetratricopeptide repeat protein [Nocardia sp. NPDC051570]|uniref:tetratricopeptide repeat protein n=1 Tax=Nocardia sp. NPDC051570 TaxID=3364324 RepID=UPI003796135B